MSAAKYHMVIIPGLSDHATGIEKLLNNRFPAAQIHIYRVPWKNDKESYDLKITRFLDFLDSLTVSKAKIVLVGISAGGSFATNAYAKRKKHIHKVINVCGRLRAGRRVHIPMWLASVKSKAFVESVQASERNLEKFTASDRKKFMTMKSLFDEMVPRQTVTLEGATNVVIPMVEHVLSQAYALCLMNKKITAFIQA